MGSENISDTYRTIIDLWLLRYDNLTGSPNTAQQLDHQHANLLHLWTNTVISPQLFYVAQIFYKITINLTKASIVLLYLRIFVQRWFRICCYILLGLFVAYMIATVGASIWQCSPIEGAWDKSMGPTCISLTKNWYANAGYSIATDVLILCLPMQPIWASKLPINQKRALMLVFALGGL